MSTKKRAKAQPRSRSKATRPHGRSRPSTVEELAAASGVGLSTLQELLGCEPTEEFPGDATIDPAGAAIARAMLRELEEVDLVHGTPANDSLLANWPREGRPFRNVVAEYVAKAHAMSPQALEAFYAVLSDFISWASQGSVPNSSSYDRFCSRSRGGGRRGRP
jgi:hypothetical protein